MHIENIEIKGQSIQSATVEGVEATDVLQAEWLAETALNRYAKTCELVNSTMHWEKTEQNGKIYSIKFF